MKACLCIETVFTDLPVHERVQPARDAGFAAIELWMADAAKTSAVLKPSMT